MPNPVLFDCPEGQHTKVATNVQEGQVIIKETGPDVYEITYRLTGEAAPTDRTLGQVIEGTSIFINSNPNDFIDVYVFCVGADGKVEVHT